MTGLNPKEHKFVREFLQLMNDDSLRALSSTITRRMLKAESRTDCVEAIILHSTSLDEFLKRQKVTKENLFKYLNNRKISVPNTDKAALELQVKELVNGKSDDEIVKAVCTPPRSAVNSQNLVKPDLLNSTPGWTIQESRQQPTSESQSDWPATSANPQGAAQLYMAATGTTSRTVTIEQRMTVTTSTTSAGALLVSLPDSQETAVTNEFAKWFFPRLNQSPGILAEDFWPDADLKLTLRGGTSVMHRTAQGGASVAQTLNATLEEHQLYLHPNLTPDGVWGRGNSEGLLLVLVCGTLHHKTANHCLGVFETLFLLAQDPFAADNWKIRTLEAILRSKSQVTTSLTLRDSELALTLQ